jgi:circadian clock protein KaiC
MPKARKAARPDPLIFEKAPTGIEGLDQITGGGLPRGRPTLLCGGAGCGKTLLALEFLIQGATRFDEPGVMIAFEETADDLAKNVASLGVDLNRLVRQKKLAIDFVYVDKAEMVETGAFDLSGLFVRVDLAIASVGAKRVVIDSLEVLFSGFGESALLRPELERLFRGLRERGITTVVTGERGAGMLTRHGFEEYISDCVILLDQRVFDQVTTRRLRVVKYRGSNHGGDEYPFLISDGGISVLPLTGLGLEYPVSTGRVSSGIPALDAMLDGKGFYRGSGVLASGTAGTGKSSIVASYAEAACARGERCLFFALEEPAAQVVRNMRSIGVDLAPWVDKGLLRIEAARPTVFGLEQHLVKMHASIQAFRPRHVIVDPVSSLSGTANTLNDVRSMLVRFFDYLKMQGMTGLFTYLASPAGLGETDIGISSLIDTWLELRDLEHAGERNRSLYVLKSRGMPHSNKVREFFITSQGLKFVDTFIDPDGAHVGAARRSREAEALARGALERSQRARKDRSSILKQRAIGAQIEVLQEELANEQADAKPLSTNAADAPTLVRPRGPLGKSS